MKLLNPRIVCFICVVTNLACQSRVDFAHDLPGVEIVDLTLSDVDESDGFRNSVALSKNALILGVSGADGGHGRALIFEKSTDGTWLQTSMLRANNAQELFEFGCVVAGTDEIIAIASRGNESGAESSVHIFRRNESGEWGEEAAIVPSDSAGEIHIESLATHGDSLLIGANVFPALWDGEGGRAYLFSRESDGNWTKTAEFVTDGHGFEDEVFGKSVALSEHTLVVSGFDYAIVYEKKEGQWISSAKLPIREASLRKAYLQCVAIHGTKIGVGIANEKGGSVYLFESRDNGTWEPSGKLTNSRDGFGAAIALGGDVAAVGRDHASGESAVGFLYKANRTNKWKRFGPFTLDRQEDFEGVRAVIVRVGQSAVVADVGRSKSPKLNTRKIKAAQQEMAAIMREIEVEGPSWSGELDKKDPWGRNYYVRSGRVIYGDESFWIAEIVSKGPNGLSDLTIKRTNWKEPAVAEMELDVRLVGTWARILGQSLTISIAGDGTCALPNEPQIRKWSMVEINGKPTIRFFDDSGKVCIFCTCVVIHRDNVLELLRSNWPIAEPQIGLTNIGFLERQILIRRKDDGSANQDDIDFATSLASE